MNETKFNVIQLLLGDFYFVFECHVISFDLVVINRSYGMELKGVTLPSSVFKGHVKKEMGIKLAIRNAVKMKTVDYDDYEDIPYKNNGIP